MKLKNAFVPLITGLCLALTLFSGLSFWRVPPVMAQIPTVVPTQNSNTLFSLTASKPSVNVGETFDLNVTIETDLETRTGQVNLTFDPELVEVIDVVEGDFYKSFADANGANTLMTPPSVEPDNNNGIIPAVGISIMGGPTTGVKGKGVLVTVHVKAKANGQAKFGFGDKVRIFDNESNAMGGVKTQDLVVPVGGGSADQPTPRPQQNGSSAEPTAVLRATSTPENSNGSGGSGSSFPWIIGIPILGAAVIGLMVVLTRKKS